MIEQRTAEWFAQRLGKVTASRMGDVLAKPTTARYQKYQIELVTDRLTGSKTEHFVSPAMEWGTVTEPQAQACYSFEREAVIETGFHPHPTLEMAGASPDGLVGEDGLIEIKCPSTHTHVDTLLNGKIKSDYVHQMQWQMACTGREWCDFVSFDPRLPDHARMYVQRVERDTGKINEMEAAAKVFLDQVEGMLTNINRLKMDVAA